MNLSVKSSRVDGKHHTADVGDSNVQLLEVGCPNMLVLKRESLESDALELSVGWARRRIARVEVCPASIELIEEPVGILVRNYPRGVHSGVPRSVRFPGVSVERFMHGCPRTLSVS